MDRALQLHALLGSYFDNIENTAPVSVLYRCSTEAHRHAYEEVFSEYQGRLREVAEEQGKGTFRPRLLEILQNVETEKVFFLVDDNLFVEKFDLNVLTRVESSYVIPSMRMGANLRRSYTVNQEQDLPPLFPTIDLATSTRCAIDEIDDKNMDDVMYWRWSEGSLDWGYPLSVDGHVFNTAEIAALAEITEFTSPNTFEGRLQEHAWLYQHRRGMCFRKSRLINIPCNRVQEDYPNLHGTVHQDALLELWQQGLRLNYQALYGINNESAHQDLPLEFVERGR